MPSRRSLLYLGFIAFFVALLWGSSLVNPLSAFGSGFSAIAQRSGQVTTPWRQATLPLLQDLLPNAIASLEANPVYLDGRVVFSVSGVEGVTAKERAQLISQRLQSIAAQLDKTPPEIEWQLDSENQLPILKINRTVLMTLTAEDAQLLGVNQPRLMADELVTMIRQALTQYQQERQPSFLGRQVGYALIGLVVMLGLSWILRRQQRSLTHQFKTQRATAKLQTDENLQNIKLNSQDLQNHIATQQRNSIMALQRWCCRIGQVIIWGVGFLLLLGLFPYTRPWRPILLSSLGLPVKIGAIALTIYGLIRFGHVLIDRLFFVIQHGTLGQKKRSQRLALRFATVSKVTKNVIATCLIASGVFMSLSLLGLDLGPLLAGAGIIGLALSFASQNLIKDVINGFLILLEDQFGVGDVIVVGNVAGFVENMNLRITQLRNEEGRLITIPNSEISIVQNLSKEWSRVDLMIPVSLNSDLNQALALIHEIAEEMCKSEEWSDLILEPPMVLGVDQLDHVGATVRLWIMTQPLKQWDVAREYRRRLKIAFDRAKIDIGVPQQALQLQSPLNLGVSSSN